MDTTADLIVILDPKYRGGAAAHVGKMTSHLNELGVSGRVAVEVSAHALSMADKFYMIASGNGRMTQEQVERVNGFVLGYGKAE